MAEKVFNLAPVRQLLPRFPNMKIIVETVTRQVLEAIEILGIDTSRIILIGEPVFVRKLFAPYVIRCGVTTAVVAQSIRGWFQEMLPPRPGPKDIIVLERSEPNLDCRRCLLNSKEVVDAIRAEFPSRRVTNIMFGNLPLRKQIEMLSQAEFLVAPHGAGLVNMVFLPNNGKVIEIANHPSRHHFEYYGLSMSLNLFYRGLSPLKTSNSTVDFNRANATRIVEAMRELLALDQTPNPET
jgi:capsular polysaccharide biosynthesis protein